MTFLSLIITLIFIPNFLSAFYALHFSVPPPTPSPFPNPTPTLEPENFQPLSDSSDASPFVYPHAIPVNSDNIAFISSDNTTIITNWYKQTLKNSGMNTTSFVQTNTNGNILNKLTGNNGKRRVDVEISKASDQPETKIVLYVE